MRRSAMQACGREDRLPRSGQSVPPDPSAAATSVAQLVARFNVNRTTVLAHLDRNSVPRRQTGPKLSAEDVAQAAGLYRDGLSLAAIGQRFRVNASTVGKALRRADVQIRPRRGWASA
jgi:hypothetical protein